MSGLEFRSIEFRKALWEASSGSRLGAIERVS